MKSRSVSEISDEVEPESGLLQIDHRTLVQRANVVVAVTVVVLSILRGAIIPAAYLPVGGIAVIFSQRRVADCRRSLDYSDTEPGFYLRHFFQRRLRWRGCAASACSSCPGVPAQRVASGLDCRCGNGFQPFFVAGAAFF